jgi:hypothetical protein
MTRLQMAADFSMAAWFLGFLGWLFLGWLGLVSRDIPQPMIVIGVVAVLLRFASRGQWLWNRITEDSPPGPLDRRRW